jgi:hypothetical protein
MPATSSQLRSSAIWIERAVERSSDKLYVQYGCGHCAPPGWVNFDASPTLRWERVPILGRIYKKNAERFPATVHYGDIVRGLPIARESCQGIYCSHVLEHLSYEDCLLALRNSFTYLKPGGTFRLVVPDLEQLARAYLASSAESPANWFMEVSDLGRVRRPRGLKAFLLGWLGNSAHLWMWDERSMAAALRLAGFKHIRRAAFGDAQDPWFTEVEDPVRFEGCLGMQGSK